MYKFIHYSHLQEYAHQNCHIIFVTTLMVDNVEQGHSSFDQAP